MHALVDVLEVVLVIRVAVVTLPGVTNRKLVELEHVKHSAFKYEDETLQTQLHVQYVCM